MPNLHAIGTTDRRVTQGLPRLLMNALRPHQWLKNMLVFIPAVAAHRVDLNTLGQVSLAFFTFSMCASGGYVLNDLLDLEADRLHARKRHRPFASGQLSFGAGIGLLLMTWTLGFGVAIVLLPTAFSLVILSYLVATSAYSIRLKRVAVLDVMVLAGLYVVRVIAGGVATSIRVSSWLLAFTLFMSLSLAFLKRFVEVQSHAGAPDTPIPGRAYLGDDAGWLHSVGLMSAYLGALVLALYVNSMDVVRLYSHPELLLLVCPVLLYWMTRIWFRAHRGDVHDDPVVAIAMDPITYVVFALGAAALFAAI